LEAAKQSSVPAAKTEPKPKRQSAQQKIKDMFATKNLGNINNTTDKLPLKSDDLKNSRKSTLNDWCSKNMPADAKTKVAAIEAIDQFVVGPILSTLEKRSTEWGGYRLLYMPDHFTLVSNRKHDATPVPFAMCGTKLRGVVARPFSERNAAEADLHVAHGHELMEFFLQSGLS
jgi:hypothetical protein